MADDQSAVQPTDPRCEYRNSPLGVGTRTPTLTWKLAADRRDVTQQGYRLQLADSPDAFEAPRWDSGFVESGDAVHHLDGPTLTSATRYAWRVRVRDDRGETSAWSPVGAFETGLLDVDEWDARWIEPDVKADGDDRPAPYARTSFELDPDASVDRARLYVTARGLYECAINGARVGDHALEPGWTSYHDRIPYRTYDVTDHVRGGENVLGAVLGDGWWRGKVGAEEETDVYGSELGLLAELRVLFADGTTRVVTTDETWEATAGPIRRADLRDGVVYDARRELDDWSTPGECETWRDVRVAGDPTDTLVAASAPPVRPQAEITPERVVTTPSGQTVVDMGQNFAGRVRMTASGPRGEKVRLRHGEALDADGDFTMENLSLGTGDAVRQEVEYTFRGGDDPEVFEPRFTYHGFRYVLVEGFPGTPTRGNFTGIALSSDLPETGTFECSDPRLNRLQKNIQWTQRSNFVDIPTDCPQRERLGWVGDAQIYARTASFNAETVTFFRKWLRDLDADQQADGLVPNHVPDPYAGAGNASFLERLNGSAGWGDAAVVVPWVLYERYGDERILDAQYESMREWVDYEREHAAQTAWYRFLNPSYWTDDARRERERYVWDTDYHWGEWLEPAVEDRPLGTELGIAKRLLFGDPEVATAYLAHSASLLSRAAAVLDRPADASEYRSLAESVRAAFTAEFVDESGYVGADTQASYVRALAFDLLPEGRRDDAAARLVELLRENGNRLGTGFLSTVYLLPALADAGYPDVAYDVLLQDERPSWLYEVERGATTVWESWNGIEPDGSVNKSLNHCSPGAVGEFLYEYVAGLRAAAPGYDEVAIEPVVGGGLTRARATYESVHGEIVAGWEETVDGLVVDATIPPNATGRVTLPGADAGDVTVEGGNPAACDGVHGVETDRGGVVVAVGSGTYRFEYTVDR